MRAATAHESCCSVTCYSDAADCCREATRYIRYLLYLQHPCCWLKETPLSQPEAVCGTAGTFGAKPPASHFSTWGINHLWQSCEHTDGPLWWRFLFYSGLAAAQSMVSDCGKQILAKTDKQAVANMRGRLEGELNVKCSCYLRAFVVIISVS